MSLGWPSLWHRPVRNHFKGGRVYLGLWFRKLQLLVSQLHDCGPAGRQRIMVARSCDRGCSLFSVQKTKKHRTQSIPQKHMPRGIRL